MQQREIPSELWNLLVQWAKWCRGSIPELRMADIARSIECRKFLAPAGDQFLSVEEILIRQLRKSRAGQLPDREMLAVEMTVKDLPARNRLCLRLEYVVYKSMPISRKRRILGVTEDGYADLVWRSSFMVRNRLDFSKRSAIVAASDV